MTKLSPDTSHREPSLKGAHNGMKSISVVLPTYRRPDLLEGCLRSLMTQTFPATEIVVGCRSNDEASIQLISRLSQQSGGVLRAAVVGPHDNLVRSMNAALESTSGYFVALTDDDAEMPDDWLERLVLFFDDPLVGGVGGKDIQATNPGEAEKVGKVQWFGRIVGNHHLAVGPVRDVEVLKGVNCCFLGDELRAIGFDQRLLGTGNVANWELGVCFRFLRQGFRLVFDPSVAIVHHTGPRHDGDTNCRGGFNGPAHADSIFNETLLLLEHLRWPQKIAFTLWWSLIGTRAAPGLLQYARLVLLQRDPFGAWERFRFTFKGRQRAYKI